MSTPAQIEAVARLEAAYAAQDRREVEAANDQAWRVGLHRVMCDVLIKLVGAPWHISHKDVVQNIQGLRCPQAAPALERTAHAVYGYLSYDNNFGLARKCTWALADIGTPDAQKALERLSQSGNAKIAAYASKRLAHWQEELPRKGRRPG
jgi:hypothetical protein